MRLVAYQLLVPRGLLLSLEPSISENILLFLPITLKTVLPDNWKAMMYATQNLMDEERHRMNIDEEDPVVRFKRRSDRRPFLANHPGPDATIVWAIWSECKTDPRKDFQPLIARIFKIATEVFGNHLVELMHHSRNFQNRA